MFYNFLLSLHIAGHDFKRGVNDVPEDVEYDKMFLKHVERGNIREAESTKVISAETMHSQATRLHESLVKKADARRAARASKGGDEKPLSKREAFNAREKHMTGAPGHEVKPAKTETPPAGEAEVKPRAEETEKHGKKHK